MDEEESWMKKSEMNEEEEEEEDEKKERDGQVQKSMRNQLEFGESKVKEILNRKPIKAFVPEPLFPPFLQRKQSLPEDKWPSERLSKIEKTSRIPSQPISAWSNQDEKTNLESVPHTRCTQEDHFLPQCTISDSILPAIPDSCLLDGNLNALNGLDETRQTDDASALKLEPKTRQDNSCNAIESVGVIPKVISLNGKEETTTTTTTTTTSNHFKVEMSIQDNGKKRDSLLNKDDDNDNDDDIFKNSLLEDIDFNDSTEPFVCYNLSVSYEHVPHARYFVGDTLNTEKQLLILSKKSRSPIRKILPDRYDVGRGRDELMKEMHKYSAQEYLRCSKDSICAGIKSRLSTDSRAELKESLLASMLFQVVLEEVTLTTACESLDIDIATFITIATTWAVTELNALNFEKTRSRQISVSSGLSLPQLRPANKFYSRRSSKARKLLYFGHTARSSRDQVLHRILPWSLLFPSHELGVTKNYRNVRELVDEKTSNDEDDKFRLSRFEADITCRHLRELPSSLNKRKKMLSEDRKCCDKEVQQIHSLRIISIK